jgi:predicted outer membrane repeat protein
MDGGMISGNKAPGIFNGGGGVAVLGNGIFTINDGTISANTSGGLGASLGGGGGVYLETTAKLIMNGGLIINNTSGGSGGGIYTKDYDSSNPANILKYANINIASQAIVSGNKAYSLAQPPSNAAQFSDPAYRLTNPLFNGNLLTNSNLNYNHPAPNIVILYNANGGTGADYTQDSGRAAASPPATVTIQSLANTGITPPPHASFDRWNTQPNGGGTFYTAGQTGVSFNESPLLYAQWNYFKPYAVTKDNGGSPLPIGSYSWLAEAVAACGTDGPYTITLTGIDDDDMTDYATNGSNACILIPSNKVITLKSDTGFRVITQQSMARHFAVQGSLTLQGIVLQGKGISSASASNGGIEVIGSLTLNSGAKISGCYAGNAGGTGCGGGVYVYSSGVLTMNSGAITNNTAQLNGGGIFTEDYSYADPANTGNYANIALAPGAVLSGNMAGKRMFLPQNAADFTTRAVNPFNGSLLNNLDINYCKEVAVTPVTISEVVTGDFSDRTRFFEFAVTLTYSNGEPLVGETFFYTGEMVSGVYAEAGAPPPGSFVLDEAGQAQIVLGHGQAITILDIPEDFKIQVAENESGVYAVWLSVDGDTPQLSDDTGLVTVGSNARTFDFENNRTTPVPTEVLQGSWGGTFFFLTQGIFAGLLATERINIKRKRAQASQ